MNLVNSTFRIVNQEGLFLTNNSSNFPLEEQIKSVQNLHPVGGEPPRQWIKAILINKSLKQFCITRLLELGINSDYILPDPDKIIKSAVEDSLKNIHLKYGKEKKC